MSPYLRRFALCVGPATVLSSLFMYYLPRRSLGFPLKNNRSLSMFVQLAAFNFIPAKFQSRPSPRPLTFGAHSNALPHLPVPFPGLLVETALVLLFSTLVDRGFAMYSGNTSKKSKRQQFSAWISLWLNPLIIHGVPEREGERWRGMFYPLITPTFTPSCLSVVLLLLVALLLYS